MTVKVFIVSPPHEFAMREMPGKMTKVPRKKGEELGPTMHVRMLLGKSRLPTNGGLHWPGEDLSDMPMFCQLRSRGVI